MNSPASRASCVRLQVSRLITAMLKIALLSALVISCSPKTNTSIRLGVNVWPGYEYLFLARKLGYYEEEGLNLQLVETGSLDDLRRAFERGKLDGMASSAIEVVQAAANTGRVAKIFMVPDFSNGADVIIAKTPIQRIADLKGKRVGLEMASLGQFMVARALQESGLSMADVVIVPMSQEEMLRGMAENQVDAVMTYPPVSVELLRRDDTKNIFSSADIPGEVMDVVTLSDDVLVADPSAPKKIIRAWQRALDYAAKNPDKAHRIAADREGISAEEFAEALGGVKLLSIKDQQELFADPHVIEQTLSLIKDIAVPVEQHGKLPKSSEFIYAKALMELK